MLGKCRAYAGHRLVVSNVAHLTLIILPHGDTRSLDLWESLEGGEQVRPAYTAATFVKFHHSRYGGLKNGATSRGIGPLAAKGASR